MDSHGIKIVLEPPRFARRGVAMHTPVSCYIRVPVRRDRDEQGSSFDLTTIIRWTGTIRNIRTLQILQLDVDETRFFLADESDEITDCMETPDELLLFIFDRYVIPEDTPSGHYTMDFVFWYSPPGITVGEPMEPFGAASSRLFEVIVMDDAPLDALSGFLLLRFIWDGFLSPPLAFSKSYASLC